MDEDKKNRVVELFKRNTKPRVQRAKPAQRIVGNGNIQAGGDIHIITERLVTRPRVVVTPGDGVISDDQKRVLADLRNEWMTLHADIKKRPLSHATAWNRINRAAGATSYHCISQERYEDAVAFVRKQMAILRGMASAPAKDKAWRASRIGAIKARCANQLGDPVFYRAYIRKNFDADSLSELATDELQKTYTFIMGKKAP